MVLTRNRDLTIHLFDILPYNSDSDSENNSEINIESNNMSSPISELTNPFAGVIDLKDKVGLTLYNKATDGLNDDNKFDFSQENAKRTVDSIEQANQAFFWGHVCFKIAAAKDGMDYDLITQYNKLTVQDVIAHSKVIWGSGTSYNIPDSTTSLTQEQVQRRIRSSIISKWLTNSMKPEALKDIMLDKEMFQFRRASNGQIENDGPTMLKLILTKINPSTRVGVRNLVNKLTKMDLADYKEDVVAMVDSFQSTLNEIKKKDDKGFSNPESAIFDALLTTKNKDFEDSINSIVREWEKGTDFTYEEIKEQSLEAYRNLLARYNRLNKTWLPTSSLPTIPDQRDVQIQALRTEVQQLKNNRLNSQNSTGNSFSSGNQNNGHIHIDAWRKSKTKGDTCLMDGKQWWWCPEHKREGDFDGLYVTHPPGDGHQKWLARRRRAKRDPAGGNSSYNSGSNTGSANSLVLSDQMRQALLTHHGFDEIQMQAIEEVTRQGN